MASNLLRRRDVSECDAGKVKSRVAAAERRRSKKEINGYGVALKLKSSHFRKQKKLCLVPQNECPEAEAVF